MQVVHDQDAGPLAHDVSVQVAALQFAPCPLAEVQRCGKGLVGRLVASLEPLVCLIVPGFQRLRHRRRHAVSVPVLGTYNLQSLGVCPDEYQALVHGDLVARQAGHRVVSHAPHVLYDPCLFRCLDTDQWDPGPHCRVECRQCCLSCFHVYPPL